MKEHDMHILFDRSEQLEEITDKLGVSRSVYWWLEKEHEETGEHKVTDPELNQHEFLQEGADVVIAWIGAMRSAGVSWEVAFEALLFKYDVIEERLMHTADLMGNGKSYDENYQAVKGVRETVVFDSSTLNEDVFDI